ncbi:response regulator [Desulforhopalus sp. IMCC35007]|uniref:response regulator n=1 Tax=Desulforhopalus sp. IMCC35007 TaxID=2569543 RepID=UPI0010AECA0B|nr:response regulator [Desulforhopalus sp. IMCC35007]TKB06983.1 response regulator [Desulforhopalus sp. IMCC35007]
MTPKSILLVDDEETVLASTGSLLAKNNFAVTTATSGQEAINLLRVRPYDLVITDLKMAGVDGISVLIQAKILFPHISVIILSGDAKVSSAIKAFKLGADDFLEKPFSSDELLDKANGSFAKQELQNELQEQNEQLKAEIATRKIVEGQLQDTRIHLKQQIEKQTIELSHTMEELNLTLATLRAAKKELDHKNLDLNNINTALTVMLQRREQEHEQIHKELAEKIDKKVIPLLKKAHNALTDQSKDLIATAIENLMDILISHPQSNQLMYANLTPRELQIVYYIRKDKTSKQMAALLGLKVSTVEFYRENIRKKLRIKNKPKKIRYYSTII